MQAGVSHDLVPPIKSIGIFAKELTLGLSAIKSMKYIAELIESTS